MSTYHKSLQSSDLEVADEGGKLSFLPTDSESDGEFFAPMRTEHPNLVLVSFANLRNLSQIFPKNSGIEKKFAGQCLGMKSEQELVEFSGSEKYARLASAPDEAQPHSSASIVNLPAEPCDVKLDAEGLARSLPSDNPESSHPVTVSPAKHHLSITIDAKTAGDSRTNEVVQTLTSFTDLTEPEPSNTEGQSAIDQIPAALENDHITNSHSDTRPSTSCPVDASIPLSKEAESHAETSQKKPSQVSRLYPKIG
ncbi:hypothetical protein PCANC_16393 [Puccinia coronata f. sp. avenae]|uniref:Uncharacterized protein n=1 Tax=Puccinia coronata f. sp. avenae TaxID=200324 RepID=A0A2N5SYH2_9BASI|nr:hypothetical protein PCANC_16393 [Puccinia coronata f. sp. avenae]